MTEVDTRTMLIAAAKNGDEGAFAELLKIWPDRDLITLAHGEDERSQDAFNELFYRHDRQVYLVARELFPGQSDMDNFHLRIKQRVWDDLLAGSPRIADQVDFSRHLGEVVNKERKAEIEARRIKRREAALNGGNPKPLPPNVESEINALAALEEQRRNGASDSLDLFERWSNVVHELGLGCGLVQEFIGAVLEGKWRTASNPKRKLAARTKELRALAEHGPRWQIASYVYPGITNNLERKYGYEIHLEASADAGSCDQLEFAPKKQMAFRLGRQYRRVVKVTREELAKVKRFNALPPYSLWPDSFDTDGPMRTRVGIDWNRIFGMAGLDSMEKRAARFKVNEISRDKALAAEQSDESRKELQAAFKRLDRGKWAEVLTIILGLAYQNAKTESSTTRHRLSAVLSGGDLTMDVAAKTLARERRDLVRWVRNGILQTIDGDSWTNQFLFREDEIRQFKQQVLEAPSLQAIV